jgi:hypothetical protein
MTIRSWIKKRKERKVYDFCVCLIVQVFFIKRECYDITEILSGIKHQSINQTISTYEINCSPTFSIFSDIFVIQNMN